MSKRQDRAAYMRAYRLHKRLSKVAGIDVTRQAPKLDQHTASKMLASKLWRS